MNATTEFSTEFVENISFERPQRAAPAATPTAAQIKTFVLASVEVRSARCDSTKGARDMTVVTGLIESCASVGVAGISSGQMTSAICESWTTPDQRTSTPTLTMQIGKTDVPLNNVPSLLIITKELIGMCSFGVDGFSSFGSCEDVAGRLWYCIWRNVLNLCWYSICYSYAAVRKRWPGSWVSRIPLACCFSEHGRYSRAPHSFHDFPEALFH